MPADGAATVPIRLGKMPRLSTLASLPLTLLILALLVLASGLGGAYWHYRQVISGREQELEQSLVEAARRQQVLEGMIDRLTRSRRLAQIVVTHQKTGPAGLPTETTLLMVELGADEEPVARHCFTIPGHIAFFDGLVVKFDHDAVATAHPMRGQTVVLLRRVYSDLLAPKDGLPIDAVGEVPAAYAGPERPLDFEKKLWERFWDLCNDPVLATEYGVRVAQGEAVYKPMKPGVLYELTVDADGGLNLMTRPLPEAVGEVLAAVGEK